MSSYYVFMCHKCGAWGSKEVQKLTATFICRFCNKRCRIKKKDQYGLAMKYKGPYVTPKEAMEQCKVLNGERDD